VRVPVSNAEFLAVVIGSVAFASGLAGYLQLSPIVVCFLAGVLVTNFPNEQRESLMRILNHLERPVQLLFLIVAGTIWAIGDWRGWLLAPLFVAGRALGKFTGLVASKTAVGAFLPSGFADHRQLVSPVSSLSIALVVSIDAKTDASLPWLITAVIGGAMISEALVQLTSKPEATPAMPIDELDGSAPIDELDDRSSGVAGPIYRDEAP
jgi:hypothetical protein